MLEDTNSLDAAHLLMFYASVISESVMDISKKDTSMHNTV